VEEFMRIIVAALALSLLACCTEQPSMPLTPLDVGGPAFRLNVATINITHDYIPPRRAPNVDHLADITPTDAVKKWVGERLQPAGHINSLEVDIKDASIVRKDLPRQTTGIVGAFTTEQTEEYDGTLEVEIKLYSPQSLLAVAHLDVAAHQTLTLPDNATPIDREHVYHQMTVDLMNALKPQLDDNIRRYFGNYIM
jgi:hypothetical protein